jgi:hypothetical protein
LRLVGVVEEMGLLMMVTYKGVDWVNPWLAKTNHPSLLENTRNCGGNAA